MKMARASEADLEASLDVCRILEDLEKRYMPCNDESKDIEWFNRDDRDQCQRALGMLLDAASKGSMLRVCFGMTVMLDPHNELLDPDADTLEKHPKIIAALAREPEGLAPLPPAALAAARAFGAGLDSESLEQSEVL